MGNKFKFGTNKHQTLPFTIAGQTFFSKPLTIGEELPLASMGDHFDEAAAGVQETRDFLIGQAEFVAGMLRTRLTTSDGSTPPPPIDTQWVLRNLGMSTYLALLQFLRTGQRPTESLELRNWNDEPIEIDGFSFAMRQLSFDEQLLASELSVVEGGTVVIVESSLKVLAALLSNRLQTEQEPKPVVTPEWLSEHLTAAEVQEILGLLQNGPDTEGDDPNVETPANLELVADGLTTTLA